MLSTLFNHGFRPFFLAAAAWSAIAVALWIGLFATGGALPSRFDPLSWHIHEMLFGFAMAAIAGFLLTAIPNWTRRLPVSGWPLALLAGLWLLGRGACIVSALMPAWAAIAADLSFPVVLVAVAAREIVAGRNWRNLPVIGPVTILGIANLLMHLEAEGADLIPGVGWRLGLGAVIALITVVGGRIVPSFTRNWLRKQGGMDISTLPARIDALAVAATSAVLLAWAVRPDNATVGWLLLASAALHLWRFAGWKASATIGEPLLLVLHLGYAWLVLGLALLGIAILSAHVPETAAIHALTAGAVGTMILAVMSRATLGHTGHALAADRVTTLIYVLVTLAAALRIAAVFSGDAWLFLLNGSAGLWTMAFALFVVHYGPMLLGARPPR